MPYAISTKFQGNSFRHPKAGRGVTQTHRQRNDLINHFYFFFHN
jgi:hypothetical protein